MRTRSQENGYPKYRLALLCLLPLLLAHGCWTHNAFALEDENWKGALHQLEEAFQAAQQELKDYNAKLNREIKDFKKGIAKLEKKKGQMMLWFGGSYDPEDLNHLIKGIQRLRQDAQDLFKSFGDLERNLESSGTKLDEMEAEFRRQLLETPTAEYIESLTSGLGELSTLKIELNKVNTRIASISDLHNSFAKHLDDSEDSTRKKLSSYWRIFYLQPMPSVFSKDAWSSLQKDLRQWLSILDILKESLQGEREWIRFRNAFLQGILLAAVLIFLGWILIKKVGYRTESTGILMHMYPAWTLFSLCASAFWVDRSVPFTLYAISSNLNEILFGAGLVSLYGFLHSGGRRIADQPAASNPYWYYWGAFAPGLCLDAIAPPYAISLVLWCLVLIFMGMMLRWRAVGAEGKLELIWTSWGPYLLFGMGVFALVGFATLSFLIAGAIFYLLLAVAIGIEAWRLLKIWETQARDSEQSVYIVGFIAGIGFPSCLVGLFFLNMWLLSLRFGGTHVFFEILSFKVTWRDFSLSLTEITFIVVGFYLTKTAIFASDTFFSRLPRYRPDLDRVVVESLLTLIRYIWWAFFGLYLLFLLGIDLTSLAVIAGGLSVGIGFGLQHIVNNFFSGLILLAGRAIQSGDTIQIGNILGDVRKVTIRNTVVQTRENATLFVPNSDLITNQLINWSHRDPRVVREIQVGVAYGADTGKVTQLLLEASEIHPSVLANPPPEVLFWNFGASTLDFKIKFWIENVGSDSRVLSEIRYEIDRLFRENGIEFAYPQSDVHLRTAPGLEKLWTRGE